MKQGGDRKKASGFTIVETLIVLAVTGLLLVSAIAIISGRQARTEFQTSVTSLQQQIQQVINETTSGYYPNNGNYKCTSGGSGVSFTPGAAAQGTNGGCLFLGKVLQFGSSSSLGRYFAYPTAGSQYVGSTEATSLAQANPIVVTNFSETKDLQGGLTIKGVYYNGVSSNQVGAFGVLAGDATGSFATTSTSGLDSGSEQFSLYAIKNTGINDQSAVNDQTAPLPTRFKTSSNRVQVSSVTVCVTNAPNRMALITVGGNNGLGVHTDVKYGSGATC